jgi:thiol-disulfide isomerase/thioredoxin
MKRLLVIVLALGLTFNVFAQNRKVEFQHKKWNKIVRMSKKQNKLIFLDCYTSWCGPCKTMLNKVFTQDKVADYMNDNFICTKYDMQKGEGITLKKKFKVTAFPTFLVIDENENVVHRIVGAYKAGIFIDYLANALTKDKSSSALQKRYENGERNGEFMYEYLCSLRWANKDKEEKEVANKYLTTVPKADLLKKENWNTIKHFMNDPSTAEFLYVMDNLDKLYAAQGNNQVNAKMYKTYRKAIQGLEYFYGKVYPTATENAIIISLQKYDFPRSKELLSIALLNKYSRNNNLTKYASVVDAMVDYDLMKATDEGYDIINRAAVKVAKESKYKEDLERAKAWFKFAASHTKHIGKKEQMLESQAKVLEEVGSAADAKVARDAAKKAGKEAEKQGKKIHSIPAFKMTTK